MKERIDEYDMAKKMMEIMRGGYKPLLSEFVNAPDLNTSTEVPTQNNIEDNPAMGDDQNKAQAPSNGRESLIPLDDSYFEIDKNDDRYKAFVTNLAAVVPTATVTSIFISKDGGLAINGYALKFSSNSGLYFTMTLAEDSILISSENVQGKIGTEVQGTLQKFLDNLRADAIGTKQYLFDPMIDKDKVK